jgi:hypothetical protein
MHPLKNARVCASKALRAGAHTPTNWHQGARADADCVVPRLIGIRRRISSAVCHLIPTAVLDDQWRPVQFWNRQVM